MQETIILENKKEFVNSIRNEFIPICIKNNMKDFVLLNQKDMFTVCDFWCTPTKAVTYKDSGTYKSIIHEL